MSKDRPLFITSRAYDRRVQERDAVQSELDQFEDARPYLGLAQDLRRQVQEESEQADNVDQAVELALAWAKDREMRRIIEEYARNKRVELTEAHEAELRQQFIENEQPRIDQEVAAAVAAQESQRRQQVARTTEQELKRLGQEALFEKIDTEEARKVLQRFGEIAVAKAAREALVAELKDKAQATGLIEIADLPVDTVLSIGLHAQNSRSSRIYQLAQCDRVLDLRVLNPERGVLEVVDDSWMGSEDAVRRANALEDQAKLTMLNDPDNYAKPRISQGTEPDFSYLGGDEVNLFGLEARFVEIYDQPLFQ